MAEELQPSILRLLTHEVCRNAVHVESTREGRGVRYGVAATEHVTA
jgi:hypothetical protein